MRAIQTKRFSPLQPVVQRRARVRYSHHGTATFRRLAALAETNNKLAAV